MNLKDFESRLQELVEVGLVRVLPGRKVEDIIIQKLAAAMHTNAIAQDDGTFLAPNVYTLILHPDAAKRWQDHRLSRTLIDALEAAGHEAGLRFATVPVITISPDATLLPTDVNILASHRVEPMAETKGTSSDTGDTGGIDNIPENAFLIVDGVKVHPLNQAVVNIGRRLDNQLVIDDPRVSRNHAQLRAIKGRFVVFDLNSTGGTFVNGQRTSQSVLYPGDVISLAGVTLIFGQDNAPPNPLHGSTSPYPAATADRPTASLKKEHSTAKLKKKT